MIGPSLQPRPGPNVDPRLILANNLIQYSALELEQAIAHELEENPALEVVERLVCERCGHSIQFGICGNCAGQRASEQELPSLMDDFPPWAPSDDSEEELDLIQTVAAPLTLPEWLLAQLRLTFAASEHRIALYVVGSLDGHGYFTGSVEEIAQALQVDPHRVQVILSELQQLDPPGVGARNARECLLLQLQRLEEQSVSIPLVTQTLIVDHLEALGQQHFEHIRQTLRVSREEIEEAFAFIHRTLYPYPAAHYYAHVGDPPPAGPSAAPSLLIHRSATTASGYEVEVVESQHFLLRMSPAYVHLSRHPHLTISSAEAAHVTHFLDRARLFIRSLQRRYLLLHQVATYLVNYQQEFLERGPLYLRPLTQTAVAHALGIHTSTISRVAAGKLCQLPSREVLPLSRFFAPQERSHELIGQIISNESEPLSDAHIAGLLERQYGIHLSRQMVAKYREGLGIQAARKRAFLRRGKML